MESSIVEEYLEAIYRLHADGRKLGTTELSRQLAVSPASATEMVDRLSSRGLVTRDEISGISLTRQGSKLALQVVRRHRISERFLVDVLGMDWKDVHGEACRLEHAISPDVAARMESMLHGAATCPHGQPIPDTEGRTAQSRCRQLSALKPGQRGVISMVSEEGRDLLGYLASVGLVPGTTVVVEQAAPFGGPLLVTARGARTALAREIAEKVWVGSQVS